MAFNSREEEGASCSADAHKSSKFDLTECVTDWRSWEQLDTSPPSTSPAWNSEEDEDSGSCVPGTRASELYGKFTWKIENFSQISKRELRSNMFEVGGYKWYILVYPQGCDVCNHLSLFLCVADHDKLLPGWSHFVQFTIAVVNKDPKKSKYSDTLHRFCKKEHDWGWKKFMELSKVLDGFTVADTLVIKAQVQVIRENPHRPFRCLDCQYRRELVRVYMTNVEGICRRFVEEKREKIGKLMEDSLRWPSFRAFWTALEENVRRRLSREKTEIILKAIVKAFFNEKEVTSTLVMDALYSGCKALDYGSKNKKGKINGVEMEEARNPVIWVDKDFFVLAGDVLLLLERASKESLPSYKDEKGPQNRTKEGVSGEDFGKDTMERDERRLTELGRRTVEMFVLAHLFSNRVEVAYLEAIALKRQEELIREEEAAGQAEIELKARREAAEKEKRNKKKQAKQRRNNRKEKEKDGEEKQPAAGRESRQGEGSTSSRATLSFSKGTSITVTTTDLVDDDDDSSVLDNTDGIVGTLRAAQEDGDADQIFWEREGSEFHQTMEASFSGGSCIDSSQNGRSNRKQEVVLDDSSSTCSSDSFPSNNASSGVSGRRRSNTSDQNPMSMNRVRGRIGSDRDLRFGETKGVLRGRVGSVGSTEASSSNSLGGLDAETVIASLKKRVQWLQQRLLEKEEEVVLLHEQLSLYQHHYGSDLFKEDDHKIAKEIDCSQSQADSDSVPLSPGRESSESLKNEGRSLEELHNLRTWSPKDVQACSEDAVTSSSDVLANGNFAEAHMVSHSNAQSLPAAASIQKLAATCRTQGSLSPPSFASVSSVTFESIPVHGLTENLAACSTSQSTLSSGMITDSGMPRPSSAPGLPEAPRPYPPFMQQSHPPPLARSVSATGRLGATASEPTSSSTQPCFPVVPSYRNAAAGMIRSNTAASSSTYSDTGLRSQVFYSHASSSESYGGSPAPSGVDQVALASATFQRNLSSGHGATAMSAAITQGFGKLLSPGGEAERVGGLERTVVAESRRPNHNRRSGMGLTFGTVTPEVLHLQHQQQRHVESSDSSPLEANFSTREQESFQENFRERHFDSDKELQSFAQRHIHGAGHSNSLPQKGSTQRITGQPVGSRQARRAETSTPMSEEFPHLDIINELLDDDKMLGAKALNAFLQQPVAMHELRRMYGGQVLNSVHGNAERGDRVLSHDSGGVPQFPNSAENIRSGLGEGIQLHSYARSSLQCSLSHPGGLVDTIPGHHWQGHHHGDMPATTGTNGLPSGLDVFMGYPMQGPHLPIVDCPPFPIGQNGYPIYSPMKHP